ncbi:MAG TPA: hypothetical protein VE288_16165 [Rubrobacteraceae bacterium]|jgi:hypothetical protein|nr:hypothetical protein [Rubrobacteraceae bacterium]
MSNWWIVGVVVGLVIAAIGAIFVIKRVRSEGDVERSISSPLGKAFRLRRASAALAVIAFGLVFCFVSLYMLYRSYSSNFSDKVGTYTGQAAISSSKFDKSGRTSLVINSIDGESVEATLHSDSGLYADGPLSGTISGNDPPEMTLEGTLTGFTGGFSPQSYSTDVVLYCQFPSQNQIECSYSSSPESDTSISPQSGSMTLTKSSP